MAWRKLWVQRRKHSKKRFGSKAANTRLNVSCEGMPLARERNVLNHSDLAFPKSSMSLKLWPPHRKVQMAMTKISTRSCSLVRLTRGSDMSRKDSAKLDAGCFCIRSIYTHVVIVQGKFCLVLRLWI